jgi:branched-subunit amino acid transport protein
MKIKIAINNLSSSLKKHPEYLWYLGSFIILIICFCELTPFWLTNDDVGLAMVANGYGTSASPTHTLVFSNVAWGYLINWFPNIGGVQSYTWITYIALTIFYIAIHCCLIRSNVKPILGATLGLVFFLPVVIYPQFTLVSGYLACAGVGLILVSKGSNQGILLALSACLLILSGLVRLQELLLVLIVAAPSFIGLWLGTRDKIIRKSWIISSVCVVVALAAFQVLDQESYNDPAWRTFNTTNHLRAEFTDFNLSRFYYANPKVLQDTGYTKNDVSLFNNWFFVDPAVFSPNKITRLIKEAPWSGRILTNLKQIDIFWRPFRDVQILFLIAVITLLLIFHQRRRYLFSSILVFAGIMLLLVALGRGGITRIYIPVFVLLAFVGTLQPATAVDRLRLYYPALIVTAIVALIVLWTHLSHKNTVDRNIAAKVQTLTCQIPDDSLVVNWGSSFPYIYAYRPFRSLKPPCQLKIYSLGSFALAPFELDQLYAQTGYHDLVTAMLAGRAFNFITTDVYIGQLQQYFAEHYSVQLKATRVLKNEYFSLYQVKRIKSVKQDKLPS